MLNPIGEDLLFQEQKVSHTHTLTLIINTINGAIKIHFSKIKLSNKMELYLHIVSAFEISFETISKHSCFNIRKLDRISFDVLHGISY
jgi:hypothetical protein